MLPIPSDPNIFRLADWMELSAIQSLKSATSGSDLAGALRRASISELQGDESREETIGQVIREVQYRADSAGDGYPFNLVRDVVSLRGDWTECPSYTFCLCESYTDFIPGNDGPKLFEKISRVALERYLSGSSVRFGDTRDELPWAFDDAVDELCTQMNEGGGYSGREREEAGDAGVDVVGWKSFPDDLASKIIMFGQCATSDKWDQKREKDDLNIDYFCRHWLEDPLVSPEPVKSFFMPHRVDIQRRERAARWAGVLFDRCRIAHWTTALEDDLQEELCEWTKTCLEDRIFSYS